jgi:hypothetical protein
VRSSTDNSINNYNTNGFIKKKVKYITNSTLNKGFLEINTIHKGKFSYYDYNSNIKYIKIYIKIYHILP